MGKFIDLTGQRFGRLTVVGRAADKTSGTKPKVMWQCRCDCGNEVIVTGYALKQGTTVSCGCKKIKHNLSHKERLYNIWKCMRQRCYNPNNPSYPHYGGKGVEICDTWYNDYMEFRDWAMANGYTDELSIDRIDVNGNYCPENCRWADDKQQANNQTKNKMIIYEGQRYTMSQLAELLGLSYSALQHRIERGWSIERIVKQNQRKR